MIGDAMMPSTVTAAPTMPVAMANTVGGQDDHEIERAAHRREQHAERREQPLHQPRLLGDEAHEDEQRHRRQQLLLHHADGLEVGEVEHRRAQAEVAEGEGEEQQREGDRHADEDRAQQHHQHDQADECVERSYLDLLFVLELDAGARHVEALEQLGDALDQQQQAGERHDHLNGHRIGRHGVWSDVSPIWKA